ncbi:cytochrome P450 [Klebsormidium nitens]|uniref:Cytochrome P450 n=1 Tax=Klebsormidium nitens TaxID=105231 RepID=A0A1Y1HL32_KLENI|nr:cytochrome P450 [Klebsormidium nitens]|eukprot:GAQ79315.1 cytochrome P450 [Klebsormidium nitens]
MQTRCVELAFAAPNRFRQSPSASHHAMKTGSSHLSSLGSTFVGSAIHAGQSPQSMNCRPKRLGGARAAIEEENAGRYSREEIERQHKLLAEKIASGSYSVKRRPPGGLLRLRRVLARAGPPGRGAAKLLADIERGWRLLVSANMPEARGDIREIVGQPVFVPLYRLFLVYGGVFRLSFGPKSFVIISDPLVAKQVLFKNAKNYSKGILSEILEFVMGTGLIPADGEVWKVRRRAVVPALHKKYVAAMVSLFARCADRLGDKLEAAHKKGESVEMESLFSRMALDVIGKAVFNYEFDSLSHDTGIVEAVYVTLKEAEYRSVALFPYWKVAVFNWIVPRQRRVAAALKLINATLNDLIAQCKRMVDEEETEFHEEYVNAEDPSILRFLLAAGDEVSSKQLRDDLMTMLIAGHETSAAVLTWTTYLLSQHPAEAAKLRAEVDSVLGDRVPTIEDMRRLRYTTRVINEAMRLYPQPPVLIRRAMAPDELGGFKIKAGQDIFISTWNLHRSPAIWDRPEDFVPERWPLDGPDPTETTENYSYIPFGGGPRKCLGDQFALFESVVTLAMLTRRFTFALAPGAPKVGMTTGATIHTTDGLHMIATPRQHGTVASEQTLLHEENGKADNGHAGNGVFKEVAEESIPMAAKR